MIPSRMAAQVDRYQLLAWDCIISKSTAHGRAPDEQRT